MTTTTIALLITAVLILSVCVGVAVILAARTGLIDAGELPQPPQGNWSGCGEAPWIVTWS